MVKGGEVVYTLSDETVDVISTALKEIQGDIEA